MSRVETVNKLNRMAAQWDRAAQTADSVADPSRPSGDVYRGYAQACRQRTGELSRQVTQ